MARVTWLRVCLHFMIGLLFGVVCCGVVVSGGDSVGELGNLGKLGIGLTRGGR